MAIIKEFLREWEQMKKAVRAHDEKLDMQLFKAKEAETAKVEIGQTSPILKSKRSALYAGYLKAYKWYRYGLFPISWFLVRFWWWLTGGENNLLHAQGIHYLTATTGGGKSLLAFHIVEEKRNFEHKNSYVNSAIEKPVNGVLHHKVFKFGDFWDDNGKLLKRPNGKKYATMVFDEIHRQFNPRNNKRSDYNAAFTGWVNWLVLHRHVFANTVYVISQLKLDIQLQTIVKWTHSINVKKKYSMGIWLKTGNKVLLPRKFYIETYVRDVNDQFVLVKQHKKPVNLALLERFETHAFAAEYDGLKLDGEG